MFFKSIVIISKFCFYVSIFNTRIIVILFLRILTSFKVYKKDI